MFAKEDNDEWMNLQFYKGNPYTTKNTKRHKVDFFMNRTSIVIVHK